MEQIVLTWYGWLSALTQGTAFGLQGITERVEVPVLTAAVFGLIGATAPCQLTTNLGALAWVSAHAGRGRPTTLAIAYVAGKVTVYTLVGGLVILAGLQLQAVSIPVVIFARKALGPLMVLVGLGLADWALARRGAASPTTAALPRHATRASSMPRKPCCLSATMRCDARLSWWMILRRSSWRRGIDAGFAGVVCATAGVTLLSCIWGDWKLSLIERYVVRRMLMSIAEKIYEVAKPLPESLALEALHFVEYLSSKNADRTEMSDLTRAQEIVMRHVWDNQDDEVWNDLKTL